MAAIVKTLAALVFTYAGWQLFPDGPLAFYALCGLLVALLCLQQARRPGIGRMWAVYAYGIAMGLGTTTCGGLYAAQADGYHFLCDKGSGVPISLISGGLALAVAVYILRGKR